MAHKIATEFHYEVFDGRGIATVWTVERRARTEKLIECVGTVYGVHTKEEAAAAWAAERRTREVAPR